MIEIIHVCQHLSRHPVVQFMQATPAFQFRHPFLIIVITQPLSSISGNSLFRLGMAAISAGYV